MKKLEQDQRNALESFLSKAWRVGYDEKKPGNDDRVTRKQWIQIRQELFEFVESLL